MITALDTNVILAVVNPDHSLHAVAQNAFLEVSRTRLVVSPFVYSELCADVGFDPDTLEESLESIGIYVDKTIALDVWNLAGRAFREYAIRRRKQTGEFPRRILADFLIGAHALTNQAKLLTLDTRSYRVAFPTLELVNV
jgi:predicted nucleic acid-binding protein